MDEQKAAPQNEGPQNYTISGGEIIGFRFDDGREVSFESGTADAEA
jgi:hypothetical protein